MILKIGYDFENLALKDLSSETGRRKRRRRRRRRRRFVVPRPGTTLSHLAKIPSCIFFFNACLFQNYLLKPLTSLICSLN
jgi:hypothetical protein